MQASVWTVLSITGVILVVGCGEAETQPAPQPGPSDGTATVITAPATNASNPGATTTAAQPPSPGSNVPPSSSSAVPAGGTSSTAAVSSAPTPSTAPSETNDSSPSQTPSNSDASDGSGASPDPSATPEPETNASEPDGASSPGCGKTPTLKNSPPGGNAQQNSLTAGGVNRQFIVRWPTDYDNTRPYRLVLGLHGAGGSGTDIAGDYFGLWDLAEGSTIFVALSADGGFWDAASDLLYVDDVLAQVTNDLCVDTSRVFLEGFSQGAAMAWTLTCSRPGVFGAVVGHSGGGVPAPGNCEPVPYFGSLGLDEGNNSQVTQTDRFAQWNGCTVETLPTAPDGGHVCTPYPGCPTEKPVVWCSFDGGHTPSPTDAGQRTSWMPERVWEFLTQF